MTTLECLSAITGRRSKQDSGRSDGRDLWRKSDSQFAIYCTEKGAHGIQSETVGAEQAEKLGHDRDGRKWRLEDYLWIDWSIDWTMAGMDWLIDWLRRVLFFTDSGPIKIVHFRPWRWCYGRNGWRRGGGWADDSVYWHGRAIWRSRKCIRKRAVL